MQTGEKAGEASAAGGVWEVRRLTLADIGLDDHFG